ncbi:Uncharacterized phage-associated protein [Kaistia soli DSM 19436]|uniref:Uncharacterized phage-associated protein n=1 Tax=Kaistia soli DSM 19436 TaxID=1122133 RepID=A0A1M5IY42_9HYPH|nr:type II toxin-antitoxin system antitoxin SocA domain-containing protein [Kaistia soli]SHG33216.1 Uncharacterized phage-associated protein [Kaistia soli DSM 19436]
MSGCAVDARMVCNLFLEQARELQKPVTNLALQKLLYFAHGLNLVETGEPLVSGYFEAWQYGPVHPGAYQAFKAAGAHPIDFLAGRRDPMSGTMSPLPHLNSTDALVRVRQVLLTYRTMTPGRLVEISHATDAPWHFVVTRAKSGGSLGMRIPDDVIRARFRYHKVSIGLIPAFGEPDEEAPYSGNGPG